MSFAQETKNELARVELEKKCCMLAEISGFLRVSGSITLEGLGFSKFKIKLITENAAIARHFKKLFQDYFGIETTLEYGEGYSVKRKRTDKKISYIININSENKSEQILRECGILSVKEGSNYITDGIYPGIVKSKCCKKSYLRGVFLGCGTIADPKKGYDLEFVLNSETLANDIRKLIGTFVDMEAKVVERGKKYVCYIKKGDYISDMLNIMGATSKVLEFEDIRVKKSLVSLAKREANCDNANLDKTLKATQKQLESINKIKDTKGLDILSPSLKEIANLRIENPYISIETLGELCDPKISKSGANNRLKMIEKIAKNL